MSGARGLLTSRPIFLSDHSYRQRTATAVVRDSLSIRDSLRGRVARLRDSNDRPDRRIRFADVVEAWKRQTRADRVLEWLVVATRGPTPAETALLSGVPIWSSFLTGRGPERRSPRSVLPSTSSMAIYETESACPNS